MPSKYDVAELVIKSQGALTDFIDDLILTDDE